jgi:hypothetical protein
VEEEAVSELGEVEEVWVHLPNASVLRAVMKLLIHLASHVSIKNALNAMHLLEA